MKNKKQILYLLIGIILILITFKIVYNTANNMQKVEFQGNTGQTLYTATAKILGAKKPAFALLWIDQTLNIGMAYQDHNISAKTLYETSNEMSYLNPYFVGNYYIGGAILGILPMYHKYKMALNILEIGVKYNPKNKYIKNYVRGILGYASNNDEQVLTNFEKVVKNFKSPVIINTIAKIYQNKYVKTKNIKYIKKAIYYWYQNYISGNIKYSKVAKENLEKYFKKNFRLEK